MIAWVDAVESPLGPIDLACEPGGALLRVRFRDGDYRMTLAEALARDGYTPQPSDGATAQACRELREYWAGQRHTFSVPLALRGTAWQQRVWRTLCAIPLGATRTYQQLAAELGNPRAARAVGRANATNCIPIVVPCHRLVGANGDLTGFEGGLRLKRALLDHEAAVARATQASAAAS